MRLASVVTTLLLAAAPAAAEPQDGPAAPETSQAAASDETLNRIRTSLAVENPLGVRMPHFYAEVVVKQPTIAEYFKGTSFAITPIRPGPSNGAASAGTGVDVMQIIGPLIKKLAGALHDRRVQKIRLRIDRELAALAGESP